MSDNVSLLNAYMVIESLDEGAQDAFMCATIEVLARNRDITPIDLIIKYVDAIAKVNSKIER